MSPVKRFVRGVGRVLLWPGRRFFDPRFEGLARQAEVQQEDLARRIELVHERVAERHDETARLVEASRNQILEAVAEGIEAVTEVKGIAIAEIEAASDATELIGRSLADLLGEAERLGRRLDQLSDEPGRQGLAGRRIVEEPYVFRALASVEPGAKILDVGAAESTRAFELASLGYNVTALDVRPYPLSHPLLRSVVDPVQDWKTDERFDAVLCLSTEARPDPGVMARIHELIRPDGLLVLSVPLERRPDADDGQRGYDGRELDTSLDDFRVEDFTVVRRDDAMTWSVESRGAEASGEPVLRVALITARRAE